MENLVSHGGSNSKTVTVNEQRIFWGEEHGHAEGSWEHFCDGGTQQYFTLVLYFIYCCNPIP